MREIGYVVRGFLTVRRDSLRVPLSGSLTVNADPDSGLFSGDLTLHPSTINRALLGASLFSATVQIEAESPVIGRVDPEGRMFAAVTVDAVIADVHAVGRALISDSSCRTATHAVVPLCSKPGFRLELGGRLIGGYHRLRVDHASRQPADSRPGKRRRHRSDPARALSLEASVINPSA